MCGGVYWEMLQLFMCRVVIVFYNCLFSRKYLPFQLSGFSAHCFLVFPAFYYKKDLSKSSVTYHSIVTGTCRSSCSFFPPIYFIWYHWLSSTAFPSHIFNPVLFRCITFLWSKITEKNKHRLQTFFQLLPAGVTAMTVRKRIRIILLSWNENLTFAETAWELV